MSNSKTSKTEQQVLKGIKFGIVGLIALVLVLNCFKIIPTGYTGVRITMGQVSNSAVQNGFNWKIPFVQTIAKVNNKQQDITFQNVISAETSERNEVYFNGITVTYSISADKSAWIYSHVSNYENNLVSEALLASALKGVSKTLTPTDVTNRTTIEPLIKEALQDSIDEKYEEGVASIYKVVINDTTFDAEYNNKIAQKQQAQMAYETQQIENKTLVEKAEADAKAQIAKANADAEASIIAAQADAEVAKISADSAEYQGQKDAAIMSNLGEMLTTYPDLVEYYKVTNWDGKLPTVQSDGGGVIIDMNK